MFSPSPSPSTEVASVLSSPAQSMNSPQRTFGKFIPDHAPTAELNSPLKHSFKLNLTKAKATAALREARDMSEHYSTEFLKPQETPEKVDFKKRMQQNFRREQEHRQLVDEIAKLDNHDQIDRLLTEMENLKVQTEMQGKAMEALHGKSVENMQAMHRRLLKVEGHDGAGGTAVDPEEIDKDAKALENLVGRVETVESDGIDYYRRALWERVKMDELQERVWVIEDSIDEVRDSMGELAKRLGVKVDVEDEEECEGDGAYEPDVMEERRDSVFTPPSRKRKEVGAPGSASGSKKRVCL